jgi:aminopeptidase N
LDLNSISKGKGMSVFSVTNNTDDDNKLLPLVHADDRLKITFPKKINAGDTITIIIRYKGIPSDGLIISKNKYGKRTFFSDNWPNRAHNWIPCVDEPGDKASVEFIITAPSHYQVISNGLLIEETNLSDNKKLTHWKEDVPLPTKVMAIGAADFAVNYAGDVNCIPVSSWVFPEDREDGFYDFAQAKDILSFFINYIGPYPYKKLASVQSKTIFGGMENASAIFYAENSVNGNREEEGLLAHEIVHQWFGDMATEKSFAHFWLSEGFATYLSHIFLESKYGTEKLNELMMADRGEVIDFVKSSGKPVVDSISPYMKLLSPNSYQKGGWILHMLRRELGDSVFKKCIRNYYAAYAGKNAETKDLQKIFESSSGKKLDKFFSQWLHSPVNPFLKLNWKYIQKEKKMQAVLSQTQGGTIFNFPLDVEITFSDGKKTIKRILVDNQSKKIDWPVSSKPQSVRLDPSVSLLFEGTVTEIK